MGEWLFDSSFGKGSFQWISNMVLISVCLVSASSGS